MTRSECTIVVNSCDAYEDIWRPFFLVLRDQWPGCPLKIVLNTESKSFSLDGLDIESFGMFKENQHDRWGKRLRDTLLRIDTEYVIMLFDDFILEAPVGRDTIELCDSWMKSNQDIDVFYFSNIAGKNLDAEEYPGFERLPKRKDYKLNSAPALWRRERLLAYTGEDDSPWAWEFFGSARCYKTDNLFYCVEKDKENVFVYNYRLGGGVHRGRWVKSVIMPVVQKYKLDLDLSLRGIEDESIMLYKHSLRWKAAFLVEGFQMIGLDAFIFIYRSIRKRLCRLLGMDEA